MQGCKRFEDALWEAVEGGRPSPRLAAHLEQCAACRRALQEVAAGVADLVTLRVVSAPDPLPALHAKLTPSPRRGRLVVALAVAAACVVAALAVRAGRPPRRPAPAPEVVARGGADRAAPVVPVAPRPAPPAVTRVRADREPPRQEPRRAVLVRRPASRAVRVKAQAGHREAEGTDASPTCPPQGERPVIAVSLDEPCPQTTVLYPRRPEPPPVQFVTADPTYRVAPQPARFVAEGERPESSRPIL